MSYIRWGTEGSDVYVFHDGDSYVCCSCAFSLGLFKTASEMIQHLRDHQLAGDCVPQQPFTRLEEDVLEERKGK